MRVSTVPLILFFLMLTGCATMTHFTALPKPDEFSKPIETLFEQYPDLKKYEQTRIFLTVYNMPPASELIDAWGQPTKKSMNLGWTCLGGLLLHPASDWEWRFDTKKISALIDSPLVFGYMPHVYRLSFEDMDNKNAR